VIARRPPVLPKVSWVWVVPPLATSLVVLAHPMIDPWHDGVTGLAPLVARADVWLAVHLALLALALTLWMASAPIVPVGLIAVAAPLLFLDHPAPFGPVTFAAVATALAWLARSGPSKD
jgi:hypothetical protein